MLMPERQSRKKDGVGEGNNATVYVLESLLLWRDTMTMATLSKENIDEWGCLTV